MNSNDSPPWLRIAEQEAIMLGGATPSNSMYCMKKIIYNYHGLGAGYQQFANWCAAFVSYCLKKSGVNLGVFKGTACSQDFLKSTYFVQVEKPLYGSIAVWTNRHDDRFGHVAFTIGIGAIEEIASYSRAIVALGGNQSGTIKFSSFIGPESVNNFGDLYFSGFFFPQAYITAASYRERIAPEITWSNMEQLNKRISKLLTTKMDDSTTIN